MITLLASITGFVSSIIPELIKYFKDINNKKHELRILEKQIENFKINSKKTLLDLNISRDISEQISLHSTYYTNIKWVDMLNGSVRPVLAYSFFIIYVWVKYLKYQAISLDMNVVDYIDTIWSIDDQAIFAGIISFYYGQRTFRGIWKR